MENAIDKIKLALTNTAMMAIGIIPMFIWMATILFSIYGTYVTCQISFALFFLFLILPIPTIMVNGIMVFFFDVNLAQMVLDRFQG